MVKNNIYGEEKFVYKIWDKTNKIYICRNSNKSNIYEWVHPTWVKKYIKESLCAKPRLPYGGYPITAKRRTPDEFEVHMMKTIFVNVVEL
jgi:hypothetical protein